jgi:hypothetical protein
MSLDEATRDRIAALIEGNDLVQDLYAAGELHEKLGLAPSAQRLGRGNDL